MDIFPHDASSLLSLQARLLKVAELFATGWTPTLATVGDLAIKHAELRTSANGIEAWHTKTVNWYQTGTLAGTLSIQIRVVPRSGHPSTNATGSSQQHVAPTDSIDALLEAFEACFLEALVELNFVVAAAAPPVKTVGELLAEDVAADERRRSLRATDAVVGIALNDAKVGEELRVAFIRTSAEVTDGN